MFEFIDIIKIISAILITNSHYGNIWPISAMAMGGLIGNVLFSNYQKSVNFQIMNQMIIFIFVFYLFRLFARWENCKKQSLHQLKYGKYIKYISQMTLEIYLVQYMIFYLMPDMMFPLNFIVVTSMIMLGALIVNRINSFIKKIIKNV